MQRIVIQIIITIFQLLGFEKKGSTTTRSDSKRKQARIDIVSNFITSKLEVLERSFVMGGNTKNLFVIPAGYHRDLILEQD